MAHLLTVTGSMDTPVFVIANGDVGQNESAGDPKGVYAFEDEARGILLYIANTGECTTVTGMQDRDL